MFYILLSIDWFDFLKVVGNINFFEIFISGNMQSSQFHEWDTIPKDLTDLCHAAGEREEECEEEERASYRVTSNFSLYYINKFLFSLQTKSRFHLV